MDQLFSHSRNKLLGGLATAELASLAPYLKESRFEQGALLQEADGPLDHVFFPQTGMISMLAVMKDGRGIETATIGREGGIGLMAGLGGRYSAGRAVMQVAGEVTQISAARFRASADGHASLRDLIVRYNDVQMSLVHQTAACNALHHAEQRLSRWLLQTRDHCGSDVIPLTQEFLSEMLGVQRTSITSIASGLQKAGVIKYRRGRIEIVNRSGLEKISCECYETTRSKTGRTTD